MKTTILSNLALASSLAAVLALVIRSWLHPATFSPNSIFVLLTISTIQLTVTLIKTPYDASS